MGKFTVIPQDTFEGLQLDAGIMLYDFDIETGEFQDTDMICATTGGINVACVPTYSNLADDIDNAGSFMETMHLDAWACTLGFTSLGTAPRSIRLALGAADIDSNNPTKIIPRRSLKQEDFSDVWWVGDRADGGMVAVQLKYALSTAGFSLQTTKNGKGQVSMTLTGHISMNDQDTVPMVFYSAGPTPDNDGTTGEEDDNGEG